MYVSRTESEIFPLGEMEPRSITVNPVSYGEGYQSVRADLGAAVTVSRQSVPVSLCINVEM